MPKEFTRQNRIADQIQRTLAQLIQTEIADPRLGMANINGVDVSRDYSHAKIYVTFVDDLTDSNVEQSVSILNGAAGFLRGRLAKSLNTRTTPRLSFVYDKTSVEGQRINHMIDMAIKAERSRS